MQRIIYSNPTKLINISTIIPLAHDNLIVSVFELHINSIAMNHKTIIDTTNVTVNIDEDAPKLEVGSNNFMNIIQQGLANGNLFTLFHLPTRKTQGRESLVDYFESHVMTLEEYLSKMPQKTLEKE
jgi:hypothetical protein